MSERLVVVSMLAGLLAGCAEQPVTTRTAADAQAPPRLQLKLEAKETTVLLDLGGVAEQLAHKNLQEADAARAKLPPTPRLDLSLQLNNLGDKEVTADVGPCWYTLELQGPGAVEHSEHCMCCIPPPPVTIAAGQSHVAEINAMSYFTGKARKTWYWTKPGTYLLKAKANVYVNGQLVQLDSNAVALEVKPSEARRPGNAPTASYQLVP